MIYNTLAKKKMPFEPLEPGKVKMYVCGPTTYNYIHLGNARPIVVFDTVRRYFSYLGYDVTFVSIFTDVDDKIINRANEQGRTPEEVASGRPGRDGMPGTGGPGYRIKHEYDTNPRNSHVDGALAMARSQNPDSAGSQFYFCLGPQHMLDDGYTVFGTTLEGLDVIGKLRAGDVIESIRIEHVAL